MTLSVRIFTDDLVAVAPGGDSAIAAYVRQHVRLITRSGQPVVLEIATITHRRRPHAGHRPRHGRAVGWPGCACSTPFSGSATTTR